MTSEVIKLAQSHQDLAPVETVVEGVLRVIVFVQESKQQGRHLGGRRTEVASINLYCQLLLLCDGLNNLIVVIVLLLLLNFQAKHLQSVLQPEMVLPRVRQRKVPYHTFHLLLEFYIKLLTDHERALLGLRQRPQEVGVDIVFQHIREVVGFVETDLVVEVALLEVVNKVGLLITEQLSEGRDLDLLKGSQGMLSHLEEEVLVHGHCFQNLVDIFTGSELGQVLASFNL
eukprot:CAMPEP_0170480340 /NCGR_PEP_ID=MMETSP0208-20121228/1217_1 /TAXON_ID=197538 /ORGANISM="Strombidium inclinatum, Strain S3" /LENGTH=228 /DNA_ID=CAMNT_0010752871 /DNA_START=1523 /DNA_END=2208 /DNA_ORIENTATION=+